jgi:DeoR/GlpR family transcriptional regulator of sugar metabolism
LEYGLTIFTEELTKLKKLYMENAKTVYCLADHSKFDKGALITFADLKEIDFIITDDGMDPETSAKYEAQQIRMMKAALPDNGKRGKGKV